MITLNSDNQTLFSDFKNNRKIVEFELDSTRSTNELTGFYFLLKDAALTEKIDSDFAVSVVQNNQAAYVCREITIAKRKVAPYDIEKISRMYFYIATPGGAQDDLNILFQNLKNFLEEN